MSEVYALIPDRLGVSLVEVRALVARLDDGEPLEDAASNAGIDSVSHRDSDGLARLATRARDFNDPDVREGQQREDDMSTEAAALVLRAHRVPLPEYPGAMVFCPCGWGGPENLHPSHLAEELAKAGLLEAQTGSPGDMSRDAQLALREVTGRSTASGTTTTPAPSDRTRRPKLAFRSQRS